MSRSRSNKSVMSNNWLTPSNCVVCLVQSCFDIAIIWAPIRGFCQHSLIGKTSNPHFRILKPVLVINYISLTFLFVAALTCFFYSIMICNTDKPQCLIFIADNIFVLTTSTIAFLNQYHIRIKRNELNSWIQIFENRQSYGLKDILIRARSRKITIKRDLTVVATTILIVLMEAAYILWSNDDLHLNILRKILLIQSCLYQRSMYTEMAQKVVIIGAILRSFKANLSKNMENQKLGNNCLSNYTKLVLDVNTSLDLARKWTIFPAIGWTVAAIACLIINIYVLIQLQGYNQYTLGLLALRTLITMMSIGTLMFSTEHNLKQQVSGSMKLKQRESLCFSIPPPFYC